MVGGDMFRGLSEMLFVGMIAVVIVFIVGIYGVIDYFWLTDTYNTTKPVVPEMVIKNEIRNGVTKSDTTYVYKFN